MEAFLIIVGIVGFTIVLFVANHLRPLSVDEIETLSNKRRFKAIFKYFVFDPHEYSVDKAFKKRMNPNGNFYAINEDLHSFPSIAAGLLKYKKHEWIIISFEKDRKVPLIWLNKGFDRSGVSPYLSVNELDGIARRDGYTTVMIFHNHPNSNPNHFDCSKPSSQDLKSASEFSTALNGNGINLLEFICERGNHHRYASEYSDTFLPVSGYIEEVRRQNGNTRMMNFSLHLERIF